MTQERAGCHQKEESLSLKESFGLRSHLPTNRRCACCPRLISVERGLADAGNGQGPSTEAGMGSLRLAGCHRWPTAQSITSTKLPYPKTSISTTSARTEDAPTRIIFSRLLPPSTLRSLRRQSL